MKKTTLLSWAIGVFLLASNVGNAQTTEQRKRIMSSYNQEKLAQLAQTFSKNYTKDIEEARIYAQKNLIPLEIKQKNGGLAVLRKVRPDGTLIYLSTENRGSGITVGADKLYPNGSTGLDLRLEGKGMIIGLWDGGKVMATHELLGEDRVIQVDGANGLSSHATHVAGTLIGTDQVNDGKARGMAYKATAHANDFDNDLSEMVQQAANGLLISNHSYGYLSETLPTYSFGKYDDYAVYLDWLLYNAPYYTVVSSAGNDNNADPALDPGNPADKGYDLLTGMALSKNNIVVAAVGEVLNYTDPFGVVMSGFSSWGPPDDGRVKPDISAKGVRTLSSTATSNTAYALYSGTSMAAPNVTGALTLLQELQSNLYGNFMKAATLKALAIHTVNETGYYDGPDYQYGWGLLNVEAAAKVMLKKDYQSIIEENTLTQGATYTKNVTALGNEPLKVTVVWTDPKGQEQDDVEDDRTSRLVNDLDVVLVDASNNLTYPWKLDPESVTSAATKGINNVDNVEKIEFNAPSGNYTIRVTHKGNLLYGSQAYSLIVSGVNQSEFVFTPDNSSKKFCSDEVGSFQFNYASSSAYNGPSNLTVTGLPAGAVGSFTPSIITSDQDFTLNISGLNNVTPGTYNFTVTVSGPGVTKSKALTMKVDSALPIGNTSLTYPSSGETGVFILPTLKWATVSSASDYKVQISKVADFSAIIYEDSTTSNAMEVSGLNSNTKYFWRVQPYTGCVNGNYVASSFTTETLQCSGVSYEATDLPKDIPTEPGETISVLNVGPDILIGDINVNVIISHSFVSDMIVSLISPAGTEIVLMDSACGDGDDVSVTFDDSGSALTCGTFPAVGGVRKPLNPLSGFVGESSKGDWTLKVNDPHEENGGGIAAFSIQICSTLGNLSVDDFAVEGFSLYPNPAKNYFEFSLLNQQDDMRIGVYDMNGRMLIKKAFDLQATKRIDVSNLSTGVYFVEVINGNQKGTKKLIVN